MRFKDWLLSEGQISSEDLNDNDYRGIHRAPDASNGAPLHDVTGIYPDDFYTLSFIDAPRFYGDGYSFDAFSINLIRSLHGKPHAAVKVYRAIPKVITNQEKINDLESQKRYILKYGRLPSGISGSLDKSQYYEKISNEIERLKLLQPVVAAPRVAINKGDWETINRQYAVDHGRGNLRGSYRILSKTVLAKELYTDGNSVHEWGYNP